MQSSVQVHSPIYIDMDRSRVTICYSGSEAFRDMGVAILHGDMIWCQSARMWSLKSS